MNTTKIEVNSQERDVVNQKCVKNIKCKNLRIKRGPSNSNISASKGNEPEMRQHESKKMSKKRGMKSMTDIGGKRMKEFHTNYPDVMILEEVELDASLLNTNKSPPCIDLTGVLDEDNNEG